MSKERIRRFDDAGEHPDFAAQICRVGGYFSAQSKLIAPMPRNFIAALNGFVKVSQQQAQSELRRA